MSNTNSKNKSSDKRDLLLPSLSEKKIKVIGLTGVMGAGKSSVIATLKDMGVPVIDCDSINEQLQQANHVGYQRITKAFGNEIIHSDGTIDKQKLSKIIFYDKRQKEKLEGIMHPLIKKEISTWLQTINDKVAVVEVPLLFEIKWEHYFDEIWVVSCKQEILLERLAMHRNITKEEACLRLSHQLSQALKESKADYIIWNNTSKDDLKQQIMMILKKEGVCYVEK